MTKTILITGTSSGYGRATAEHFLSRGWQVIATMRRPDPAALGGERNGLRILPLDVTDPNSISTIIKAAGPIDVLVNNAGIGMVGAFEATPMDAARRIFETNTLATGRPRASPEIQSCRSTSCYPATTRNSPGRSWRASPGQP